MPLYIGSKLVSQKINTGDKVESQKPATSDSGVPTGTIIAWSTATAPEGYLICDGSAISRTTYANLFAVIGTVYGSGDGNSTFNLPNMTERVPWQRSSSEHIGYINPGSLPNITGKTGYESAITSSTPVPVSGCFIGIGGTQSSNTRVFNNLSSTNGIVNFNASFSSGIYSDYTEIVIPANISMKYLIKY